jgi:hypothetical protein
MPPRSTARFISYDLRPAKQSERRILLDLLKIAGDCGLPIAEYRYIGMGANRFYDFLLIHKYLGLSRMISLEHDPVMYKRAVFNCPYSFIDVQKKTAADFIATDTFSISSIIWLDYDGGISPLITQDIASLSTKLKVGDFCFVTVFGGPPGVLNRVSDSDRLAWFQDELGDVAADISLADVEKASFPDAVHKVLIAAFLNAFSVRRDGKFVPFLQVEYADSSPMITVGGGLLADGQAVAFKHRTQKALPFLNTEDTKLYEIKSLYLTERERVLFDRATTWPNKRSSERNHLKKLGFKDQEMAAYKDLIRYLPRYVETIV